MWVLVWAAAVMGATAVPYALARAEAGPERAFAGFIWGVDDGNVYLSWVRQAAEGKLLLGNPYTTKDQSPHFLNLFLLALGRICRVTGITPPAAFMGSRYACGVLCLLAIYLLAAEVTASRIARAAALVLASVSSGLGWLVVMFGSEGGQLGSLSFQPMDVSNGWQTQPEAIVFLSLLLNPLFALSLALMALTARELLRMSAPDGLWGAVRAGLALLVLGNIHGYDIFVLHALALCWLLANCLAGRLNWVRGVALYALMAAISAPSVIWAWYGAQADPSYAAKINTPTLSPRPLDVALGFGLVLVMAAAGVRIACGQRTGRLGQVLAVGCALVAIASALAHVPGMPGSLKFAAFLLPVLALVATSGLKGEPDVPWRRAFPVLWAACGFAVIYLPAPFQRKMLEGLHIPLCILAGIALASLIQRPPGILAGLGRPVRVGLAAALVVATLPSNLLLVSDCMRHVRANNRTLLHVLAPPVYLARSELQGMRWLADNAAEGSIVMASSLTGNHIPAHAPCRVVAGHWAETINFAAYVATVGHFYRPTTAAPERLAALDYCRAEYVWYGPQERLLQEAQGDEPVDVAAGLPGLKTVYTNDTVRIYRRVREADRPRDPAQVVPGVPCVQ